MTTATSATPPKLPIPLPSGTYYGWVIVAVSWLANFVGTPLNPVVFSIFIDPMRKDLDVSLGTMAWVITAAQVSAGLAAPIMGRLIDAYGTRWMGVFTGVVCGSALIALSFVHSVWIIYLLFALTGLTGLGTFGGNLITVVPPGNWFVAKRGRAVAIAATGGGIGTAVAVTIAQTLIHTIGWRSAWVVFGIVIYAVIIPSYAFLMRRRPEDLGLHPDGAAPVSPTSPGTGSVPPLRAMEVDWTLQQAMRTPVLWVIIGTLTLYGFCTSAILFLRVPFWNQMGVSPQAVALGVAADPFTVMITGLIFGFLAERYPVRFMAVIGGVWRAISMLPLILLQGASSVFAHNITWGIGSGGFSVVQNIMIPVYFGRRFQGSIRGIQVPLNIAAAAIGAPLAGYLVDRGLSIDVVWEVGLVLMFIAGIIFIWVTPPKPSAQR